MIHIPAQPKIEQLGIIVMLYRMKRSHLTIVHKIIKRSNRQNSLILPLTLSPVRCPILIRDMMVKIANLT